jgi:hypothetical protein
VYKLTRHVTKSNRLGGFYYWTRLLGWTKPNTTLVGLYIQPFITSKRMSHSNLGLHPKHILTWTLEYFLKVSPFHRWSPSMLKFRHPTRSKPSFNPPLWVFYPLVYPLRINLFRIENRSNINPIHYWYMGSI